MALRKRADTYVARNQFKEALPDLEAALKLKPDDPDILQNLQYVQAKAGAAASGGRSTSRRHAATAAARDEHADENRNRSRGADCDRDHCHRRDATKSQGVLEAEFAGKEGDGPEEISLTLQSALLACRRFFGERDEVPWSFKTEV